MTFYHLLHETDGASCVYVFIESDKRMTKLILGNEEVLLRGT